MHSACPCRAGVKEFLKQHCRLAQQSRVQIKFLQRAPR